LFSIAGDCCPNCGAAVLPVQDVAELAIDRAIRQGTALEVVRGDESESALMNAGGIGAFLKTRTASLRAS
jgi:peptide subunit release factor 1 (eRF1)